MNNVRATETRTLRKAKRHPWRSQPRLEILEGRLPPGDAVLGLLLAWPEVPPELYKSKQELVSAIDFDEREKPALVSSRSGAPAEDHPSTAISSLPTDESTDLRAAGLIPAVFAAGINRPAHSAAVLNADGTTNSTPFAIANHARNSGGFSGGPVVAPLPALRAGVQNSPPREQRATAVDQSGAAENYGKLPLSFEANQGQTDSRVDFMARMGSGTVFLTPTAAVFSMQNSESRIQNSEFGMSEPRPLGSGVTPLAHARGSDRGVAVYMQVVGANPKAMPIAQDRQPGIVNYFIGNDPSQWHANIPTFGRVEYQDVYPGVDLAYYGNNGQLEYDFIVSPGADPNQIGLNFAGADGIEINRQGDLVLHTAAGNVVQKNPLTYQESGATRQEIASRYVLDGSSVRFELGAYDPSRPLVIDPLVLGYSTFLGGGDTDTGASIAVDANGNAYVTGTTRSNAFPTTPGAFDTNGFGNPEDVFVTKLRADGTGLLYSTYLSGGLFDYGYGIAVDGAGNAYVTGETSSDNFPTTPGAFDTTHNGGSDAFVTKLNASGSALVYSTFLGGGPYTDIGYGIAVDGSGSAYVTGYTASSSFPTTPSAFDTTFEGSPPYTGDAFVTRLRADGAGLLYSTFLGGVAGAPYGDVGQAIAVDASGSAYVTGATGASDFPTTPGAFDTTINSASDAFVTKLNASGSALVYSTFLGGSTTDHGDGIAVDGGGNAYVTGFTGSSDFPTTPGAFDTSMNGNPDAFVTRLRADGTGLLYSTYLGGSTTDHGHGIAVDGVGNAYVTGITTAANFPTTPDAFDTTYNAPDDAFMTKLNASGSALVYSTFLGGNQRDYGQAIAVDRCGSAYVTGYTESTVNFPTTPGAFDTSHNGGPFGAGYDAFVAKFSERRCRVPAVATQVVP